MSRSVHVSVHELKCWVTYKNTTALKKTIILSECCLKLLTFLSDIAWVCVLKKNNIYSVKKLHSVLFYMLTGQAASQAVTG